MLYWVLLAFTEVEVEVGTSEKAVPMERFIYWKWIKSGGKLNILVEIINEKKISKKPSRNQIDWPMMMESDGIRLKKEWTWREWRNMCDAEFFHCSRSFRVTDDDETERARLKLNEESDGSYDSNTSEIRVVERGSRKGGEESEKLKKITKCLRMDKN